MACIMGRETEQGLAIERHGKLLLPGFLVRLLVRLLTFLQLFFQVALALALQLRLVPVDAQELHDIVFAELIIQHNKHLAETLQEYQGQERYEEYPFQGWRCEAGFIYRMQMY